MAPFINNGRKRRANDSYAPAVSKRGRNGTGTTTTVVSSAPAGPQAPQVDDEGNTYWEIANKRRVTISEFRGKKYVSIREYFEKDGRDLPGKKGIALSVDQFSALIDVLPQIDGELRASGNTITRPAYPGGGPTATTSSVAPVSLPALPARPPPLPSRSKKPVKEMKSAERVVETEDEQLLVEATQAPVQAADGTSDRDDQDGQGEEDDDEGGEGDDDGDDDERLRLIEEELALVDDQPGSDESEEE